MIRIDSKFLSLENFPRDMSEEDKKLISQEIANRSGLNCQIQATKNKRSQHFAPEPLIRFDGKILAPSPTNVNRSSPEMDE